MGQNMTKPTTKPSPEPVSFMAPCQNSLTRQEDFAIRSFAQIAHAHVEVGQSATGFAKELLTLWIFGWSQLAAGDPKNISQPLLRASDVQCSAHLGLGLAYALNVALSLAFGPCFEMLWASAFLEMRTNPARHVTQPWVFLWCTGPSDLSLWCLCLQWASVTPFLQSLESLESWRECVSWHLEPVSSYWTVWQVNCW